MNEVRKTVRKEVLWCDLSPEGQKWVLEGIQYLKDKGVSVETNLSPESTRWVIR